MNFNYRFSIIPPGAITDPRVTPRALQVLCLLGRHIDNDGWCTRSQVKMARELACSRSTVQEACDILLDTGWAERRANGRGGRGPETSEQPFAAYSYRVRIDRNDLPSKIKPDDVTAPVENAEGGAAPAAGGAAPAAGGAAPAAPLEGIPSEGISSEPERDARAREHEEFAKWLSAFLLRWPTAAADDQSRIANASRTLSKAQRKAALDAIPEFLDHLQKLGRKHPPAGWKYLEELRWERLPAKAGAGASAALVPIEEGTTQWKIWQTIYRIARPRSGIPPFKLTGPDGHRRMHVETLLPEAMVAITEMTEWLDYSEGAPNYAAWRRWLCELIPPNLFEHGAGDVRTLRVPCPWPPRKDGTIAPPPDSS